MLDGLISNVRTGLRGLGRSPAFTISAILTLALGIGLSTAVFTVAEALLLRRLPIVDQERVVVVSGRTRDGRMDNYPLGLHDAREFAARARTLERVALYGYEGAAAQVVRDGDQLSRLHRSLVSGDFFTVLGARALIGRTLQPEDDLRGAAPAVVLSHRAWVERFGASADVIGRRIVMHDDGTVYTIVGVMPRGLDWPRGTDAWAPVLASTPESNERYLAFNVIARLRPGVPAATAAGELTTYFRRDGAPAWQREMSGVARDLPRLLLGETRPAVLAVAAASALLLLITCINVANLLLVRGIGRIREIAVRSALGAARGRLVAQLLVEHGLLAIAAGALGVLVAAWAVSAFVALAPAGLPRLDEIHLDLAALGGAAAITGLATLLFALAPAVAGSRVDAMEVMRSRSTQTAGRVSRLTMELLVVGQIALALIVLSGAALLGRSFAKLARADLAFDPSRLLVSELALRTDRYDTPAKQQALLDELLPRIEALPGVRAATPVVAVPFSGTHGWDGHFTTESQTATEVGASPMLNMEVVAPSYFATFGLPALRGRVFTDADRPGVPTVIVVSQSTARHFWPGADPIGRQLLLGAGPEARRLTVIGIVPDTRYRDLREPRASVYFPLRQSFFPFAPTTLVIRTAGDPAALVPALRRVVAETSPGVAVASAAPLPDFLAEPLARPRLNAILLAVFAGAAVVLAAIGLFSVMAMMVHQRTREIGVRMALGATAGEVARTVVGRGVTVAAAGAAIGLLGALATNRLMVSLLFGIEPGDPATLAAVAVALLVIAAIATAIPARAGSRIEPAVALRTD